MNIENQHLASILSFKAVTLLYRLSMAAVIKVKSADHQDDSKRSSSIKTLSRRPSVKDIDLDLILSQIPATSFHMETLFQIRKIIKKSSIYKKIAFKDISSSSDDFPRVLGINDSQLTYSLSDNDDIDTVCSEFSSSREEPRTVVFSERESHSVDKIHFDRYRQMWTCTSVSMNLMESTKLSNCKISCFNRGKKVAEFGLFLFKMLNLFNDSCMWIQDYSKNRIVFVSYQTMYHQSENLEIHVVMINPRTRRVLVNRKFKEDKFCRFINEGNEVNLDKRPFYKEHRKVLAGGFINDEVFHGAVPVQKGGITCFLKYRESVGYLTDQYEMKRSTTYHLLPLTLSIATTKSELSLFPTQVETFKDLRISLLNDRPLLSDGDAVYALQSDQSRIIRLMNKSNILAASYFDDYMCLWHHKRSTLCLVTGNVAIVVCSI